uniref:Uncharacterized protein n=1 Tax=Rhizophora mucronata TaxID=61149 RepID=A0A2P2NFG4_RHIMU
MNLESSILVFFRLQDHKQLKERN